MEFLAGEGSPGGETPGVGARREIYQAIFAVAAVYNVAWGLWVAFSPKAFFTLFTLPLPADLAIWRCLGMVVGLYGALYAFAAWRPERGRPIVTVGLLGKILGPIGWVQAVAAGGWPRRTFSLILFNDLIWWVPFALFLLEGTSLGRWIRARAPEICAFANAAAAAAMLFFLRGGSEIVSDVGARSAYITAHSWIWRVGWCLWIAAALSLLGFYSWWSARIAPRSTVRWALVLAAMGIVADLLAESIYIGWFPEDLVRLAPIAMKLTGGVANGLYSIAGALLTLATRRFSVRLRQWSWSVWICGFALTAFSFAGYVPGVAVSTALLTILFCPWVLVAGRALR